MESPLGKAYLTDESGKTVEITSQDCKKEVIILTKEKYDELLTKVAYLEDRVAWLTMKMEEKE